jgi:hypothetical protein
MWREFYGMKFPVIEIVDRYTIAVVKHRKTNGANQEELNFYLEQMKTVNINPMHVLVLELIEHHAYVWSLEDDFKKNRIDGLPLEEIGRIAITVRDQGYKRTELKNALAELAGDTVKEIKQDHSSE